MLRREFFPALTGFACIPALAERKVATRMTITDIRVIPLRVVRDLGSIEPAWSPGSPGPVRVGGGSFTEVHTDQGLVGIGPGMPNDLLPAVRSQIVGEDPFEIETLSTRLRNNVPGLPYHGSAGVDIALWDLIGKACGQPLYKLWGGGKDEVRAYASMIQLSTPDERARMAKELLEEGWTAIKLRLHHESLREDIRTVEMVRDAVGDNMSIMADANQAQSPGTWQPGVLWDFQRAVDTARELQRLGCVWLEEPLPRFAWDRLAELARRVEIPIAGGENNSGPHEFLSMLREEVYDILQPESMVLGGVTALRKIGVLAEAFDKRIVPHHGGGNLGTIAHLHLVAAWRHAPYLELLHDPPASYQNGFVIMHNPPTVDHEGLLAVPKGPGLGVEINSELIEG